MSKGKFAGANPTFFKTQTSFKLVSGGKTDLQEPQSIRSAERNLIAAIIGRAIVDAYCKAEIPKGVRREAKRWLLGEDCKAYCDILELDHLEMLKALLKEPQKIVYAYQETSEKFYRYRCNK